MKNKDPLENFIAKERELFDFKIPNEIIWIDIARQINPKSLAIVWYKTSLFKGIAAGFILLIMGGYIGFQIGNKNETPLWSIGLETKPFLDFEIVSQKSIQKKLYQLKELNAEKSIYADLHQIDKSMEELKSELKNIPMGQEKIILEQLKLGYQTKIEILDKILQRLEPKTQSQNENEI
jgi:hypothetical protein